MSEIYERFHHNIETCLERFFCALKENKETADESSEDLQDAESVSAAILAWSTHKGLVPLVRFCAPCPLRPQHSHSS